MAPPRGPVTSGGPLRGRQDQQTPASRLVTNSAPSRGHSPGDLTSAGNHHRPEAHGLIASDSRTGAKPRRHAGSLEARRVTRPEAVACASVSVQGQGGASPPQVDALRPVTDGNRVAARRGGKQPEVNRQSATQVNSIRPSRATSLQSNGEVQTGMSRVPPTLRGSVSKRWGGRGGGWRRNGPKARHMKQRDLPGPDGPRAAGQESEEP